MKLVIISGGSGNDALVKGLNKICAGGGQIDLNIIVNAYDNGKSTGVCRALTNTLGVSDIRKNHSRLYEAIYAEKANPALLEFYNNRYNFEKGKELEQITSLLRQWNMSEYIKYVDNFFANAESKNFTFKDFSVSNIVYAEMFKEIGYEKTNKHFCDKMGINDFVILNSFDNVYIKAQTQSGHIIEDEGETVFWNNPNDKIIKTIYQVQSHFGLNQRAIELVKDADLIVISTGTFWSSIQPTIEYLDFYKHINASKAKKIWVLNNEEDGDSFGVSSLEFVKFMEETGLDLNQFTILVNADARDSLKFKTDKYNFVEKSMGNNKGKHDGDKFARALLQIYYGLEDSENYDKILFDFDDTIWARDKSDKLQEISKQNIELINNFLNHKAVIISGNSYASIQNKLACLYGRDLSGLVIDIWADANSSLYRKNKLVEFLDQLVLDSQAKECVDEIANNYNLSIEQIGIKPVNFKIKPLTSLERRLLTDIIKTKYKGYFKADITGKTTVDILNVNNDKSAVFKHCNFDKLKTLYIGDELKKGNDFSISQCCTKKLEVKDVAETNLIIRLLIGE